jgi:hypothetical protein
MKKEKKTKKSKEKEDKRKPAADVEQMGEWFLKALILENKRRREEKKEFEPGEGIELPLND